jgi:hypothetical protein
MIRNMRVLSHILSSYCSYFTVSPGHLFDINSTVFSSGPMRCHILILKDDCFVYFCSSFKVESHFLGGGDGNMTPNVRGVGQIASYSCFSVD